MIDSVKARTPILALILFVFTVGQAFSDPANWGKAMCCSIFQQFVRVTAMDKKRVLNPNKMPSRAVYVKLFG